MAFFVSIEKDRIKISSTAKILKAGDYTRILSCDKILEEARTTADQIISEAKAKAKSMIQEAESVYTYQERAGYEDGVKSAKIEMAAQISRMAVNTSLHYHTIEEKIVELVMDTVRKVLVDIDKDELIVGLAKKALEVMKNQKQLTLKVSPDQIDFLNERIVEITAGYPRINSIEIKGDERLEPDDLIMESDIGIVEAGVKTQLSIIEEAFRQSFRSLNSH